VGGDDEWDDDGILGKLSWKDRDDFPQEEQNMFLWAPVDLYSRFVLKVWGSAIYDGRW
jgi:hypothetical protein